MKKLIEVTSWLLCIAVSSILLLFFYNTKIVESHNPSLVAPTTTKFLDIGSETIAYREINNEASTTVVFVGGLSSWGGTWERVVQALNDQRKDLNYIVVDLPPFGYSTPQDDKGYFRDVQAERIEALLDNKGVHHVVLVAHSYGAGPGTEYALQNPQDIQKLIIVDGVLNIDEKKTIDQQSIMQVSALRKLFIGILVHSDVFATSRLKAFVYITDNIDQNLVGIYTRYINTKGSTNRLAAWLGDYVNDPLTYQSNFSDNYRKMTFPVRLIWGDQDTITPLGETNILVGNIPDVQLSVLAGVGHIPMIEDYARFDKALLDALNK